MDHSLVAKILLTTQPIKIPSKIKSIKFELINLKVTLTLAKYRAKCRNNINLANRTPLSMMEEELKTFKDQLVETTEKVIGWKKPIGSHRKLTTLVHW